MKVECMAIDNFDICHAIRGGKIWKLLGLSPQCLLDLL